MAMLTVHQWQNFELGLAELRRVAAGPVVVLTLDAERLATFWLHEYLPSRAAAELRRFPSIASVAAALGRNTRVESVPIPLDCTDGFVEAFYGRPKAFLDSAVRDAQSAWNFVPPAEVEDGLARLAADLVSGAWDERFGHLRTQPTYDGPMRLVVGLP